MRPSRLPRLLPLLGLVLLTVTPHTTPGAAAQAATSAAVNAAQAATSAAVNAAQAATLTFAVDSTADAPDANPGDGICADQAGQCTLRAATQEANASPGGSTIAVVVPAGTYTLTLGSLALLSNTITISGAGAATTIVDAGGTSRVLTVGAHSRATLAGLMLTGGNPGSNAYGGGVLSAGDLTLRDSVVRGNSAGVGGGITNSGGRLLVTHSHIDGNTALYYGGGGIQNGGLHNLAGMVTVLNSVVDGNVGGGDGGAILNGQNGHPAVVDGRAIAVASPCGWIPLCAQAAGAPLRQSVVPHIIPTYPLTLTVVGSRVGNNDGNNAGGGIANDGGTAVLSGDTISGNRTPGAVGGGISSYGSLTVIDSTLSHNQAVYGGGMEVFGGNVAGSVTVMSSTLSQNVGDQGGVGGGIDDSATTVVLVGSTLSANHAGRGGGLEIEGSSGATVRNSTFNANSALPGFGGGIETFECGSATLRYVTFAANSNALQPSCPDVTLLGAIMANSTSGTNCTGPVTDQGYNLDSGTTCGLTQSSDLSNTDPRLGPLAENGGPTPTMALLTGSPAIDAGGTPGSSCPDTDQRGVERPQGPACDMGAYERVQ